MVKIIVFDEIINLLSSKQDATLSEKMIAYLSKLGSKEISGVESCYDLNGLLPMMVKCCETNPNKTNIILKLFPYIYKINKKTSKDKLQFDLWDGAVCASLVFLIKKSNSMRAMDSKSEKVQLCILINLFDSLLSSISSGNSNVELRFNCDILTQVIHLLEADTNDLLLIDGVAKTRLFNNAKDFIALASKDRIAYERLMPSIEDITRKIIINAAKTDKNELLSIYILLHQDWLKNKREDKYLQRILSYITANKNEKTLLRHIGIKNLAVYCTCINDEQNLQESVWKILNSIMARNIDKIFVFDILFEKWLTNQNDSQCLLLTTRFVCENKNNMHLMKFIGIHGLIELHRHARVNIEHRDILFNMIDKLMVSNDDAYELQTTLPYKSYFLSNYQETEILSQRHYMGLSRP